jgi:hypothetical protein
VQSGRWRPPNGSGVRNRVRITNYPPWRGREWWRRLPHGQGPERYPIHQFSGQNDSLGELFLRNLARSENQIHEGLGYRNGVYRDREPSTLHWIAL